MNQIAMADHALDQATRLETISEGHYSGRTSEAYWNMNGPFGGTTAAVLLQAVLRHADRRGVPVALTVNYCAAIAAGEFEVTAQLARSGRSTQHWRLEVLQADRGVVATGSVVTGEQRATWDHMPARPPAVPPANEVAPLDTAGRGAWLQQFEFRVAEGLPNYDPSQRSQLRSPRSHVWVRDAPARPLDFIALASLADSLFVRVFQVRGYLVPIGTVSMTTYFFASEEQLARQGSRPLLSVGDARIFRRGFSDQLAELWSDDGELLAVSTQLVWFKE